MDQQAPVSRMKGKTLALKTLPTMMLGHRTCATIVLMDLKLALLCWHGKEYGK